MSPRPADYLLLTCEHGGNRIPAEYSHLFKGAGDVLESHRGWDLGALVLAKHLERTLRRPLLAVTWSRLFVEANRTPTNRRIWSRFTAPLPKKERDGILARWWRPHRSAVEKAVAAAARKTRVVHVAVHSFTPELDGDVRNADVSFLYDSRRKSELKLCRRWGKILRDIAPDLRVRYNYPYNGASDGLSTWLRKQHAEARYIGIEIEINQGLVGTPRWRGVQRSIAESLGRLIGGSA